MEWYKPRDEFEASVDFKYLNFDAYSHKHTREVKMYLNEVLQWKKNLLELNFCLFKQWNFAMQVLLQSLSARGHCQSYASNLCLYASFPAWSW